MSRNNRAPVFAIDRLPMWTDGPGITTLVGFMGCPLRCRYCVNNRCHEQICEADGVTPRRGVMMLTPRRLYERVKIDNLYFQATGGGICFGGGEPALYAGFIKEFRQICNPEWKITVETSLATTLDNVRLLAEAADYLIVDVKSMNKEVYKEYTGEDMPPLDKYLSELRRLKGGEHVKVRVPMIPGFGSGDDAWLAAGEITAMGFKNVDVFQYIVPDKKHQNES